MIVNLSPNKNRYYSQRNNALAPGVSCKPTATVQCLDIAGWPLPKGKWAQPEDNLTDLCRSGEGRAARNRLCPDQANTPPNELWPVIVWALNQKLYPNQNPCIGPRWDWDLKEALFGLVQGVPFAASTFLTPAGHIVSLVGFETSQESIVSAQDLDLLKVTTIIIDDPYGDRTSGVYDFNKTGWNNRYSLKDWLTVWRATGIQIKRFK
jgi:hypothetical protein